jgi:hypothetical protein
MTRSFTLITTIAGLALVLAVPAFGKGQPVDDLQPVVTPYGFDWSVTAAASSAPDVVDRAVTARERSDESAGRSLVFDNHKVVSPVTGRDLVFDNYRVEQPTTLAVAQTSSGRDLEWPQLGIGFGIGLLLALGLGLALRMRHIRPLAH